MSGLLNEIKAVRVGKPSALEKIFEQLGEKDAAELRTALADPTIKHVQIQRALHQRGIKIHHSIICRFRSDV